MSFVIKFILFIFFIFALNTVHADGKGILKQFIKNGFVPHQQLFNDKDSDLSKVGKILFDSKAISLNGDISCSTCHLDNKGSADGLPLAAAIVSGEGVERFRSGAQLLPRNTFLLGKRGIGFNTFFGTARYNKRMEQPNTKFSA